MSIDILLEKCEALPLAMDCLGKMAGKGNKCRVIKYEDIQNATSLDQILNSTHPYAIVLIMDKRKGGKVGHYIAIWLQGKNVMWYDSYAHKVKELLDLLNNGNRTENRYKNIADVLVRVGGIARLDYDWLIGHIKSMKVS
jgi:hypothetical protein